MFALKFTGYQPATSGSNVISVISNSLKYNISIEFTNNGEQYVLMKSMMSPPTNSCSISLTNLNVIIVEDFVFFIQKDFSKSGELTFDNFGYGLINQGSDNLSKTIIVDLKNNKNNIEYGYLSFSKSGSKVINLVSKLSLDDDKKKDIKLTLRDLELVLRTINTHGSLIAVENYEAEISHLMKIIDELKSRNEFYEELIDELKEEIEKLTNQTIEIVQPPVVSSKKIDRYFFPYSLKGSYLNYFDTICFDSENQEHKTIMETFYNPLNEDEIFWFKKNVDMQNAINVNNNWSMERKERLSIMVNDFWNSFEDSDKAAIKNSVFAESFKEKRVSIRAQGSSNKLTHISILHKMDVIKNSEGNYKINLYRSNLYGYLPWGGAQGARLLQKDEPYFETRPTVSIDLKNITVRSDKLFNFSGVETSEYNMNSSTSWDAQDRFIEFEYDSLNRPQISFDTNIGDDIATQKRMISEQFPKLFRMLESMAGDSIKNITSVDELNKIIQNSGKVILQFSASWCGPCQNIKFDIKELSNVYKDIVFCYIDIDTFKDVAINYMVSSLPTFIFLKNNSEVDRVVGATQQEIKNSLDKLKLS